MSSSSHKSSIVELLTRLLPALCCHPFLKRVCCYRNFNKILVRLSTSMIRIAAFIGAWAVLLCDMAVPWLKVIAVLLLLQVLIRLQVIHVVLEGRNHFSWIIWADRSLPTLAVVQMTNRDAVLLILLQNQTRRRILSQRILLDWELLNFECAKTNFLRQVDTNKIGGERKIA